MSALVPLSAPRLAASAAAPVPAPAALRYLSTRGGLAPSSFSEILLLGLAPDGGLVVPQHYPCIRASDLAAWRNLSYPQLAGAIIARFAPDVPEDDLRTMLSRAYCAETFGDAAITPLRALESHQAGGLWLLHLSNGPTLAFKDVAMQFLGEVFPWVLKQQGRTLNILGATSGDTGSAAEYALRGKAGIQVFMLSPQGRMSAFQRAQMYSLMDANIHNLAISAPFDTCQDIVKQLNGDSTFKAHAHLGAVNSINWGRIVAQVVYYFRAWLAVCTAENLPLDAPVDFAVPSGNFGNVCAGHIARQMGLPIGRLIVATNENDVLDVFFCEGRYQVRAAHEVHITSSPSMDIAKASNLERFIFDLLGRDPAALAAQWRELEQSGGFNLARHPAFQALETRFGFCSARSTHADRLATIRHAWQRWQVLIDPHTADGLKAGLAHRRPGVPLVVLETAQAVKFAETVYEALGNVPLPRPAALHDLESRPQRVTALPDDANAVRRYLNDHL